MRVHFSCGDNLDLFHFGRTLAGLYAQPGAAIRLRRVGWISNPLCAAIEVDGLRLAIELSDHSDWWDQGLLEWCDVYAKRNLNARHVSALQQKIIPLGLNWACRSRRSMAAALTAIAPTLPRASKGRLREIYRYLATPHWKAFEQDPRQPVDRTILFQTRVWEAREAPGEYGINDQRIGLLRALKKEFKHRVVGGVVPTPFAFSFCPDLVTNLPCRQPQYVRWAKKSLIGIYFRSLFDSLAFKMAEYLAASKCIVSEPILNQLPAPLDFVCTYHSADECLAACERILCDPSLAQAQRQQSWEYYLAQVRPDAHWADLLQRTRQHAIAGRAVSAN